MDEMTNVHNQSPSHATFVHTFGRPADARAEAPGRVNLIGEHTDSHGGFVLLTVLPQRTVVHLSLRPDARVCAASTAQAGVSKYLIGRETTGRGWLDYVQGVTYVLGRRAFSVPGFDLFVESALPSDAGLSSSTALAISLLRGLRTLCRWPLDDYEIALLAHEAETDFLHVPLGITDPMVCSLGRPGEAFLLDATSLVIEHVPLPPSVDLVVVDSGRSHSHARVVFNARRRESFAAAELLGVVRLCELGMEALPRIARLPAVLARRARHVVTENQRALDAVAALKAADAVRFGALLNASHVSLRDDCEATTGETDVLARIGQEDSAVFGARMAGSGAVALLARAGEGHAVATRVLLAYAQQVGRSGGSLLPSPVGV